jgi:hypothetical protein
MNIGKWIIVAFLLFAGFIATLVTVCLKQDVSLVSKNYYQDELQYQAQITRVSNTQALASKPLINLNQQKLTIDFTEASSIESGYVQLFCPSNEMMDRRFEITNENFQWFDLGDLQTGMYRARMRWTMNGKEYYQEKTLYLQ